MGELSEKIIAVTDIKVYMVLKNRCFERKSFVKTNSHNSSVESLRNSSQNIEKLADDNTISLWLRNNHSAIPGS